MNDYSFFSAPQLKRDPLGAPAITMSDGINNPLVSWLWLGSGLAWGLRLNLKYGIVPKREHLRDPDGPLYAATWNFFSREKWTDAGVAFHKRLATELLAFVAVWLGAYFLLAALF